MAHFFRLIALALLLVVPAVMIRAQNTNQSQGPSGGKTSDSAAPAKVVLAKPVSAGPKATKSSKPVRTATTVPAKPVATMDSISGKWWTTGNDFEPSQVFFEQNGAIVSGAIQYSDGRTGTFSGVLSGYRINFNWTNSSGDGGSGWLEHSWNGFLGGSYRNKKGAVGSWTLSRIAGNWCFGGSRDRIRKVNHGSRGQLFFVSADSGEEVGHLEGPWIFLHGEFGDVKGSMNYKSNRVDFDTGTFWTWCGR